MRGESGERFHRRQAMELRGYQVDAFKEITGWLAAGDSLSTWPTGRLAGGGSMLGHMADWLAGWLAAAACLGTWPAGWLAGGGSMLGHTAGWLGGWRQHA